MAKTVEIVGSSLKASFGDNKILINERDYDAKKHTLWSDRSKTPEPEKQPEPAPEPEKEPEAPKRRGRPPARKP